MKKVYTILAAAIMMVAFSSCEDDYRFSDLLGRWQLISVIEDGYEYEAESSEYEEYTFYDDGRGAYVNAFGTRVDFWWDERGHNKLDIRFDDGITEYLYYEFDRGDLILYENSSRRDGRVFRYAGGHRY